MECATLSGWLEDVGVASNFPVPEADSSILSTFVAICEASQANAAAPADATSVDPADAHDDPDIASLTISGAMSLGIFALLRVAKFLDAPVVERNAVEKIAKLLQGKTPDQMRATLCVEADLSPVEQAAALAEPLFTPPSPEEEGPTPLLSTRSLDRQVSYGLLLGDEDAIDLSLSRLDARSLRTLKAVSRKWRQRARWVLYEPMSRWRQSPVWNAPDWSYVAVAKTPPDLDALQVLDKVVELPAHVASLAAAIPDGRPDFIGATTAVDLLAKLEPAVRVDAAVSLLAHPTPLVRAWAARLMHQIQSSVLTPYAHAAVLRLTAQEAHARDAGSLVLRRLDKADLAAPPIVMALATAIGHHDGGGRAASLQILCMLDGSSLTPCSSIIASHLEAKDGAVRAVAATALRKLPTPLLKPHATTLASMIGESASPDGKEALLTLSVLPREEVEAAVEDAIGRSLPWLAFWLGHEEMVAVLLRLPTTAVEAVLTSENLALLHDAALCGTLGHMSLN
uniref:SKP1 component dimerisation domain-containing protein n=1 Tax=Haptolina brevifila TaxID=156173 RepID=A0A7S2NN14_9EUKA